MQEYQIKNNIFTSDGIKSMTVNRYPQDIFRRKNFMNGLQNARNILNDLQASLKESRKYEEELLSCRSTHAHEHKMEEWLNEGLNEKKNSQSKGSEKQDYGASLETWSTMSIVCLQYQYEELFKRYKNLLLEYEHRCDTANSKDEQISRLQDNAKSTHAQLIDAHAVLLAVGEKYMALRRRKHAQKHAYSRKVHRLKNAVKELIASADRARHELDARVKKAMKTEHRGGDALLLAEIRKCNHLCLENLRLKAQVQELILRNAAWDSNTYLYEHTDY